MLARDNGVGELDICTLCDASPHSVGCPLHAGYDDEHVSYVRVDASEEIGPARYWVEDTFALAAADAGLNSRAALKEGIAEFVAALQRGDLHRTGR